MASYLAAGALNALALLTAPDYYLAPGLLDGRAFLAPQVVAPPLAVVVPVYGRTGAFLAPPTINGLPYLAPPLVSVAPAESVTTLARTVFLAPRLFNGLAYLAPRIAPIQHVKPGMGYQQSKSANSSTTRTPKRYDDDSYRQQQAVMAAELQDEEVVLAFLIELALQ